MKYVGICSDCLLLLPKFSVLLELKVPKSPRKVQLTLYSVVTNVAPGRFYSDILVNEVWSMISRYLGKLI